MHVFNPLNAHPEGPWTLLKLMKELLTFVYKNIHSLPFRVCTSCEVIVRQKTKDGRAIVSRTAGGPKTYLWIFEGKRLVCSSVIGSK